MTQTAEPITTNNSDVNPTTITETDVLNELLKYQWTIEQEEGQPVDLDIEDDEEEEFETEDDNTDPLDPLKKNPKNQKKKSNRFIDMHLLKNGLKKNLKNTN